MQTSRHFSPLDEIIPPLYAALIFAFPESSVGAGKVLSILNDGWSKTVADRPFLSGELLWDQSNDVRLGHWILSVPEPLECPGPALNDMTLPGKEYPYSYEDLRAARMPSSMLDSKRLAPLSAGIGKTKKVIASQLNIIRGGYLFTVYVSHGFVDAFGAAVVISEWAKNCRNLQGDFHTSVESSATHDGGDPPNLRRIATRADYEELKKRPELWRLLGLDWRKRERFEIAQSLSPHPFVPAAAAPEMDTLGNAAPRVTAMITFSPTALAELKKDATPQDSGMNDGKPTWISTNNALVGLLWQNIMRARFPSASSPGSENHQNSIVTTAIQGRKNMSPPIPSSYIGNIIFCCMTELPLSTLTSPDTSLASLAQIIRKNLAASTDPKMLADAFALASCIPDVRHLTYGITNWTREELVTTSWIDLPFLQMDWGGIFGETGRPEFFRFPLGQLDGICFMHPRRLDGTIEINVGLEAEQMERLRMNEAFTKYATFVS